MRIKFFGGAHEVGRSAIMIECEKRIMLDYGAKIENKIEYPIETPQVDALVLSHAHLDHCGASPILYKNARIPTFGTAPTLKLSELLLNDSLKVAKKKGRRLPFKKAYIKSLVRKYVSLEYHNPISFGDLEIELNDAGHISGSAITLIERKAKNNSRIVYTGDYKLGKQTLHNGADLVKSDVLITEGTYATANHPDREELVKSFIERIREVIDNGGTALLPVFAVGRSQEMLALLYKNNLIDITYLDGMAKEATNIVLKFPNFIKNGELLNRAVDKVGVIDDRTDRIGAMDKPSIIVTTAGMLTGGPVLNYITRLNRHSEIFLTGYQVEGTNGRMLIEKKAIDIDGSKVRIDTPVSFYDFSAHAGMEELYRYVRDSSPNTVICVHSNPKNADTFAENLRGEGFDAYAPRVGDTITLDD